MSTSPTTEMPANALAFIQEEHRAAVAAHPGWRAIASERDPALQLVWMVRQHLLTYDDLYDLLSFDEDASESDTIIEEAFAELTREYGLANCSLLDQLRPDC